MMKAAEKFDLVEIVQDLTEGKLLKGSVLVNKSGQKVTVKDGSLFWLTDAGYISTPVAITLETLKDEWALEYPKLTKQVTFSEAVDQLYLGERVLFVVDHGREYEMDSLDMLEAVLEDQEFLRRMYESEIYILEVQDIPDIAAESLADDITETFGRKLSESDVYRIHHLRHFVGATVESIATEYLVTMRMVYYILDGTYWNNVYKEFHSEFAEAEAQGSLLNLFGK